LSENERFTEENENGEILIKLFVNEKMVCAPSGG